MENKVTHKDLVKVFWRSLPLEWSWNYERMQHIGFCYALMPILRKLYGNDPKKMKDALKRHLEFFNTTPHLSTLILGITTAMEEENAKDEKFDSLSINNMKVALMGPLAGIGDSLFWGTLRIIATGIGTSLALQGNILGPILFLLVFNIPHYLIRYYLMINGYKMGNQLIQKVEKSNIMPKITYGISILGLMVIGAMTASMVVVHLGLEIGSGATATSLQSIADDIMPGLLPLGVTALIYYLLGKGMKIITILISIAIIGVLGAYFGILVV